MKKLTRIHEYQRDNMRLAIVTYSIYLIEHPVIIEVYYLWQIIEKQTLLSHTEILSICRYRFYRDEYIKLVQFNKLK